MPHAPPPETADVPQHASAPGIRTGLFLLAALWVAVLGLLAAKLANPVVLNRVAILNAQAIVQGHWQHVGQGRGTLRVEKVWLGEVPAPTIEVYQLPRPVPRGVVLVPLLRRDDGRFIVAQGRLANVAQDPTLRDKVWVFSEVRPEVYPVNPEVERQLLALLEERRERASRSSP
ncbi:MAG: hypothetical protein KatS3mg114_1094 [Planctomycetaceae bacterium]|nr:MAG: hypothetical protein KatS3mg114_1094 [Planctomycetaceae bacterium]